MSSDKDVGSSLVDTQTLIAMADPNENRPDGSVMIIDDDDMVAKTTRRALSSILNMEKDKITVCASVRGAIEKIAGGLSPSVIVSDVSMPIQAGDALYEYLKGKPQLIPRLLFVTGGGAGSKRLEDFITRMISRGQCLGKPFKLEKLKEKIDQILGRDQVRP